MLIRRPAADLYRAFIEPDQLTRFWLASASAPLEVGKSVRWEFMVPGAVANLQAKELEKGRRILVEWEDGATTEWLFEPHDKDSTVVKVDHQAEGDLASANESTQGYTIVLCDLKTLLETGTSTNLVRDKAFLIQQCSKG